MSVLPKLLGGLVGLLIVLAIAALVMSAPQPGRVNKPVITKSNEEIASATVMEIAGQVEQIDFDQNVLVLANNADEKKRLPLTITPATRWFQTAVDPKTEKTARQARSLITSGSPVRVAITPDIQSGSFVATYVVLIK